MLIFSNISLRFIIHKQVLMCAIKNGIKQDSHVGVNSGGTTVVVLRHLEKVRHDFLRLIILLKIYLSII